MQQYPFAQDGATFALKYSAPKAPAASVSNSNNGVQRLPMRIDPAARYQAPAEPVGLFQSLAASAGSGGVEFHRDDPYGAAMSPQREFDLDQFLDDSWGSAMSGGRERQYTWSFLSGARADAGGASELLSTCAPVAGAPLRDQSTFDGSNALWGAMVQGLLDARRVETGQDGMSSWELRQRLRGPEGARMYERVVRQQDLGALGYATEPRLPALYGGAPV